MKRQITRNQIFAIVIIIVATMTIVSIISLRKNIQEKRYQRQELISDLDSLIMSYQSGSVDAIDISTITSFEWDELYLFPPYSSYERIEQVLGFQWKGSKESHIQSLDGIVLFVFVDEEQVIQYMDYPRGLVDFVNVVRDSGYTPSDAVFILEGDKIVLP